MSDKLDHGRRRSSSESMGRSGCIKTDRDLLRLRAHMWASRCARCSATASQPTRSDQDASSTAFASVHGNSAMKVQSCALRREEIKKQKRKGEQARQKRTKIMAQRIRGGNGVNRPSIGCRVVAWSCAEHLKACAQLVGACAHCHSPQ